MNTITQIPVIQAYIRMCQNGVRQGWHERNGGNLTYRMQTEEIEACRPFFNSIPGEWVPIGIQIENLAGEFFIATGSGKFLQNVALEPQNNLCIVEINASGEAYRIVWGLDQGGKPTSELPTHLMNHSVRKRVTNGANRIIYHAHPANIIAMTYVLPLKAEIFTKMLWKSATECCVVFPDGVGVVPWMVPGGTEIARETCMQMEQYSAVVWAFHGLFVSGESFDLAFGLMHTIEKAAQICAIVLAASGGKAPRQAITDENLRQIGREFGVVVNEAILNYHDADALFGAY